MMNLDQDIVHLLWEDIVKVFLMRDVDIEYNHNPKDEY